MQITGNDSARVLENKLGDKIKGIKLQVLLPEDKKGKIGMSQGRADLYLSLLFKLPLMSS